MEWFAMECQGLAGQFRRVEAGSGGTRSVKAGHGSQGGLCRGCVGSVKASYGSHGMSERGRLGEVRLGSQGLLRFAMVSCVLARQSRCARESPGTLQ